MGDGTGRLGVNTLFELVVRTRWHWNIYRSQKTLAVRTHVVST